VQETCILSTGPCYSVVTEQRASALVPMLQVLVVQWEEGRTAGSEQKFRCYSGCPISLCPNSIFTYGNTSRNNAQLGWGEGGEGGVGGGGAGDIYKLNNNRGQ
jgi:hypothetical protein